MEITTKTVLSRIHANPKYSSLESVQKARIIIAAAWVKFIVTSPAFTSNISEVVKIAENHRNHAEFNGILLDVILTYAPDDYVSEYYGK